MNQPAPLQLQAGHPSKGAAHEHFLKSAMEWIGLSDHYLLVSVLSAAAQTSQEHVKVVAHLPLNGMHVNPMFVQQRGSKFYHLLELAA